MAKKDDKSSNSRSSEKGGAPPPPKVSAGVVDRNPTIPIDTDVDALVEGAFSEVTEDDGGPPPPPARPPKPPASGDDEASSDRSSEVSKSRLRSRIRSQRSSESSGSRPVPKLNLKGLKPKSAGGLPSAKTTTPAPRPLGGLPTRRSGPLPMGGLPVRSRSGDSAGGEIEDPPEAEPEPDIDVEEQEISLGTTELEAVVIADLPIATRPVEEPAPRPPATPSPRPRVDPGSSAVDPSPRPRVDPGSGTIDASSRRRVDPGSSAVDEASPRRRVDSGSARVVAGELGSGARPIVGDLPRRSRADSGAKQAAGEINVSPEPAVEGGGEDSGSRRLTAADSGPRLQSPPEPARARPQPRPELPRRPNTPEPARPQVREAPRAPSRPEPAAPRPPSPVAKRATSRPEPAAPSRAAANLASAPRPAAPDDKRPKSEARDPFVRQAQAMIAAWEQTLAGNPDMFRAARLHYEVARLLEHPIGDLKQAASHYQRAHGFMPEHLPTLRGARRVLLALKEYDKALPLFDAEIRLVANPRRKASLIQAKGRVLEDYVGDPIRARHAYAEARDLEPSNPSALKALEQADLQRGAWAGLDQTYAQAATAVEQDSRHRAALVARRAHLLELRHDDSRGAVELYETALHLDGSVDGAFAALKRLHHSEGRWRDLIGVLEREAEQTRDPDLRAMAHYRVSRIYSERLGARDKAILALERSVAENPRYRLVLEELISLYEAAGRHEAQVQTYERLIELIEQPRERISLLYHVGELYEEELKDEESAIEFYEAALEIEPTYRPALKSLAKLYRRRQSWDELIRINLREAEASSDVIRQAAAHARVAELLEVHKKDIRGAIDHHSRALSLDANIEASFKSLARLFTREKRYHELIELLERGVDATGDADRKIAYLFRIGDIFSHELSEPIQAAHTYRRILKLDPNHLGAMHSLQRATETSGRYKELVEALELESRNTFEKDRIVALLHRAGEVLDTHLDDRDGALARYRKVLELNPKYEPALASVGKLYHRAGRWEDLLATYERELQLKETPTASVALLYTMGKLCEQKLARDTQAIACYRKAVGIDPRHGPTLHALGRKLRARGAWSELVEVLELELKSTTDKRARALAAYRIGRVHEEHLKANDLAQQAYLQALESLPDYRPALDGLARVRASERRWTQVVDDLAREAKSSSEQKIALAALLRAGEIWSEQLDQPDRAIACYEEVLRRDERNLAALMALEPLYRRKGAWNALVDVYLREAATFSDTAAVVAALREVARLYETKPLGDPAGLRRAYIEILKRSPDDPQALMAVEQMALGQRDDQMLAAVDRQLSAGDEDPALLGAYHTRLGETLEREGDAREALKAFEAALEHDPESVAAMHGLIRTATAVDEPRALVSAKKRLADFERDGEVAASLLVETARIRLTRLDDSDRAIADLERALERWPDSLEAARELYRILLTVGNATRLLDRLSTAAEAARDNERAGALWRMVAELQADELGNIAGGIAILRRVQRTLPSNVEIMMLLANLLTRNEQWNDAAHAFEQVIKMSSDVDILCDANSTLAVILSDNLQSFDRARQCLEAVLLLRPEDRTTLRMLTDVETKRGDFAAAAETARRLLRASSSLEERIDSIIHLAEIQMDAGQRAEAFEVLLSAVELEGPQGMAAREYKRHHTDNDSWEPYEAALMKRLQRGDGRGGDVTETFLELARVQDVNLGRPERAISTLEMALHDRPEDDALWVDYAARLRAAGKLEKSIRAYRRLVERSPARGEAWRGIVKGFVDLKMPGEAALAIAPLSALGEASEADARAFAKFAPRPAAAQPGSITPDRMRSHVDRNHLADVAEDFVRVMDTSLAKLYPVELQNYGLTTREKLTARSGNPVRAVSDRIAQIFGLPEHDFYVYRGAGTVVTVDFGAVPTLLVPATVLKLTETQQIFALARAHAAAVRGLTALHRFKPQDLKLILAAAARAGAPNFGDNLADAAALDDLQRRIYRALARKDRKAFEEQAARYAASPALDFVSWLKEHKISAIRVAALVASDLPSCVALLRQEDQSLMYLEGADLVANSDLIADLLRYWFSEPALELRRGAGMLGAPAAT